MSITARPRFPTTYAMMASGWRLKERKRGGSTMDWVLESGRLAMGILVHEQIPARKRNSSACCWPRRQVEKERDQVVDLEGHGTRNTKPSVHKPRWMEES